MVIDTQSLATSTIKLPHGSTNVRGLCLTPDGGHGLVTHICCPTSRASPLASRAAGSTPTWSACSTRGGGRCCTPSAWTNTSGAAGNPWAVACTADGKSVCVGLAGTHELYIVDTCRLSVSDSAAHHDAHDGRVAHLSRAWAMDLWRRIKLPGNGPRGLAAGRGRGSTRPSTSAIAWPWPIWRRGRGPRGAIALGPPPQLTRNGAATVAVPRRHDLFQQWQSCASCHPDGRSDALNWDLLNDGEGNPKNTKSLLLAHRTPPAMWEGVRSTAEEAVRAGLAQILFANRPEETAAAMDAYLKSLRPGAEPAPASTAGSARRPSAAGSCSRPSGSAAIAAIVPPSTATDGRTTSARGAARTDR